MTFLKKAIIGLRTLMLGLSAIVCYAKETRPNIVLILADDASPDMFSAYGQKGAAKTPNIDKLAQQGVQFQTTSATMKHILVMIK